MIDKEKKDSCCDSDKNVDKIDSCCSTENIEEATVENDCGCGCDCGTEETSDTLEKTPFDIIIDGKIVSVTDSSKNIVEIAKEAGIAIPAPCFLTKRNNGCCSACVVEINAEQQYACCTKAKEGMNIIVNREDLAAIRKERLLIYKDAIRNNKTLNCCCS